jgi:cysteinyl-tRNA synthetase
MQISFYNTLKREIEPFHSIEPNKVRLYTCGPTVYNFAHIGNLRTYIFEDILRRTLEVNGYDVNHVMNITDVGHLQSDADEGEDKMSLAALKEQKTAWDIAKFYEQAFLDDIAKLNIKVPKIICRATEHIKEMQVFIAELLNKGFAYECEGNVYFRVAKFATYNNLSRKPKDELNTEARVEKDPRKENQQDFVLWFSKSKYPNQIMKWDSVWGEGFPGWHIECTVMASKYLSSEIDIHCGGIDHISVHHTNEIAQAEACFDKKWVNYWLHGEFLILAKEKMSKSAGSFITLKTLTDLSYSPFHYRYLCLMAHYRSQLLFSFEALDAARNSFEGLKNRVLSWKLSPNNLSNPQKAQKYIEKFFQALSYDLDTPKALSILWEMAKDISLGSKDKLDLIYKFDDVLGLDVINFSKPDLPKDLYDLIKERQYARNAKDFKKSDEIRNKLLSRGIQLKDTINGVDWYYVYKD